MNRRRLVILLGFAVILGLAWWVFRRRLSMEFLVTQDAHMRQLVTDYPVRSLAIGFAVYIVASLVPGTAGKSAVYGWLFGLWWGLLIVNFALTVAAIISFFTIRYVFQEAVHRKLGSTIRRVDEALHRDGPSYLLTVRLMHAPYTLTNYVAGATEVDWRTFWWTTQVGLLPGNFVLVLVGARLPSLQHLAREGVWSLVNLPLLIALSLIALIPIAVRWTIRRFSTKR
ncbi:MAG: VTT domain-containing protein [Planctomycetes bacterium]|nr:VTT domain-containing protein [Planctomycetota bacterium]